MGCHLNICPGPTLASRGTLLIALGGHNVGDTIRRMFAKMRTHQLWSQFNMKGRKRKHSFEDLPLHKVMCKACRRIHLKCRDDEIEHHMGETLKHAPSKRGGYLFQARLSRSINSPAQPPSTAPTVSDSESDSDN
ncbi:hypothetical protein LSAT2_026973 [Lamellibrachia satsuma]|nr:hypothetical protein LSAT2_026973 [Lamellibrachia satsuma]